MRNALETLKKQMVGALEIDAPLSKVTYYQIGGRALALATPKTMQDLEYIHDFLYEHELPFFILGWGSNILFSDDGYPGLVIRMKHGFQQATLKNPDTLNLGASLGGSSLLRLATQSGWGNLHCLTGIPGSVGGMVTMNAGTTAGEVKDLCVRVESVQLGKAAQSSRLELKAHTMNEHSFSYRKNHFLNEGELVLSADFKFEAADPIEVAAKIKELYESRKRNQPVDLPSCGSVFKNPKATGLHAWQVVDRLGLKGHQIGMAQISPKHANFIVNLGGAKASDVKALIHLVQSRAFDELGIELELEVKIL
jgi:UDP-N-acetylmuramate dehydrogenase